MQIDKRLSIAATVLGAVLSAAPAHAFLRLIDHFREAVTTKLPPGITQNTVGSSPTIVDSGLPGVLGGVRKLTVTATSLIFFDSVTAGAGLAGDYFDYSSSVTASGRFDLLYDGGGSGLNLSLVGAEFFEIQMTDADAAAVPLDVTITLTDNSLNSASSTQTVLTPGPGSVRLGVDAFTGINLSAIHSIELKVSASLGGDLRLDFFAVETPPHQAPVLSWRTLCALVLILAYVGIVGVARVRVRGNQCSAGAGM